MLVKKNKYSKKRIIKDILNIIDNPLRRPYTLDDFPEAKRRLESKSFYDDIDI